MKKQIILSMLILFINNNFSLSKEIYLFDSYKYSNNNHINSIAKDIRQENINKAKKNIKNIKGKNKNNTEYWIIKSELALIDEDVNNAEIYLNNGQSYNNGENKYLLYNQYAKLYLLRKDYKSALEYSNYAFESPHLEKEFIETRVKILKEKPLENPPSIIKKETLFSFSQNNKDYLDTFETWETILKNLSDYDSECKKSNLIKRAEYELPLGYNNDALIHIENALKLSNDKDKDFYLYLGEIEILQLNEEYDACINLTTTVLNSYNDDDQRKLLLPLRATVYLVKGNYSLALDDINECLKYIPKNAMLLKMKGYALVGCQKYNEALKTFVELSFVDKSFKLSNDMLKELVQISNDYQLSIKALNNLCDNNEYFLDERVKLIDRFLIDKDKYKEALNELKKIESSAKKSSELYFSLGICYDNLKNYQTAIMYYSKAMNFKNCDPNLYYARSDLYIKQKRYKEALYDAKQFDKLLGDARKNELYYRIYFGMGNYTLALKYLNEYTGNGNVYDDYIQWYNMAYIKKILGDRWGALSVINGLIEDSLSNNDTATYAKAIKFRNNIFR